MGSRRVKEAGKKEEKPSEEKKKEVPKDKKVKRKHEGIREIVRVSEVNLDGNKKLGSALLGVKGIGKSLAQNIIIVSGLDPNALLGSVTDEQVKKIEDAINNPSKYGIPRYMLNRRSEPLTGEDQHLVSSKLKFAVKSDIDFMRKIRSYKGIRHELGLPVRGQRTRTSFRGGKAVGVSKSKEARNVARKEAATTTGKPEAKTEAKPAAKEEKK